MIPKIDSLIGILVYTTSYEGCGGKIKQSYDDFVVSEVLSENVFLQNTDGFAVYKLSKLGIDTNHALNLIYRKFGVRLKALGLKDAFAKTEQYVCSMARSKSLENYVDDKIALRMVGFARKPLSAKDMVANKFTIKISDAKKDISEFSESNHILNFYGYQRFGSRRPVTHLVGKALIQKRYDDALELLLSTISEYDLPENIKIRKELADKSKFEEILPHIPHQMDLEKILVHQMILHKDAKKAITKLPLQIRRLYVDAYQSYLYNLTLSNAYQYGEDLFLPRQGDVCYDKNFKLGKYRQTDSEELAVPLVGYSYYKKTRFDFYISKVLEDEQVSYGDFYLKDMQELSNEGGFRLARAVCKNFEVNGNTIFFEMPRGTFATMLLREIIKPQDPIKAGF